MNHGKDANLKFTDGYWQMRPGMIPHYAAQAHEVEIEMDSMTVSSPTKKLSGRGDTINMPMLALRYSSPIENFIRVQITPHKGAHPRKPKFNIYEEQTFQAVISDEEQFATLTSGDLSVRVQKGADWLIEYIGKDGVITSSSCEVPDGQRLNID